MTRRTTLVLVSAAIVVVGFITAVFLYRNHVQEKTVVQAETNAGVMVRAHSPVLGPATAAVTIVEFFDPACEACRAFYPYVKQILAAYPQDARLVMRYVPFHGEPSIAGVQILEAARRQDRFAVVLDALMESQPQWASHASPAPERAWEAARAAGLNLEQARAHVATGAVDQLLEQEVADLKAVGVRSTPTFFVNGQPLLKPDPRELLEMVRRQAERRP